VVPDFPFGHPVWCPCRSKLGIGKSSQELKKIRPVEVAEFRFAEVLVISAEESMLKPPRFPEPVRSRG
jgi:hypothetical protein